MRTPPDSAWREPQIDLDDRDAVRDYWIAAVGSRRGRATEVTGWAMGLMEGRFGYTSSEFLAEAFAAWRSSPAYEPAVGKRLLEQLVLERIDESPPSDELDEAADAAFREARCWAACELAESGVSPVLEQRLYRVIAAAPLHVVPIRARRWALDFASLHDLPEPWPSGSGEDADQAPE